MYKSISLIETLFSLIILSIILIINTNLNLILVKKNNTENIRINYKLDFETSYYFLKHKIKVDQNLDMLYFKNNTLYYNQNIFLKHVNKFTKKINNGIISIDICIKKNQQYCQTIKIANNV